MLIYMAKECLGDGDEIDACVGVLAGVEVRPALSPAIGYMDEIHVEWATIGAVDGLGAEAAGGIVKIPVDDEVGLGIGR